MTINLLCIIYIFRVERILLADINKGLIQDFRIHEKEILNLSFGRFYESFTECYILVSGFKLVSRQRILCQCI